MKKITVLILALFILTWFILNKFTASSEAQNQKTEPTVNLTNTENKTEIEGEVFYPDNRFAPDALIFAFKNSDSPFSGRVTSSVSGPDGKFVIPVDEGIYSVCAWKQKENYLLPNFLPFGLPTGGRCEEVAIITGQKIYVGVKLSPKSNSLEGRIKGIDKKFPNSNIRAVIYRPLKILKGQWQLVSPENATWEPTSESEIDSEGQFTINGLPSGIYFLRLETSGGEKLSFKLNSLDSKATPIEISLDKENKLSLSINQFFKDK